MFIQQLFEGEIKRVIAIYPGRFQPFHLGHKEVFETLQAKFGMDNVFIGTSNKTDAVKSPFNFSDKLQLMTAAGVNNHHVIEIASPYMPDDYIQTIGFNPAETVLIFAVGAPDLKRLEVDAHYTALTPTGRPSKIPDGKSVGDPKPFKTFRSLQDCETADQHQYVLIVNEREKKVTVNGKDFDASHGTQVRALWNEVRNDPKASAQVLQQLYGRATPELAHIFNKIPDANAAPTPVPATAPKLKAVKQPPPAKDLNEFAPSGGDDGNDGFSDETLKRLAAQWWQGDEDPRIEKTLMASGWEIGQDEGYDNGGVFVVQAGDVNGNSYISWPAEELEGLAEDAAGVGVIANKKQKNDLRYSMSMTKDVGPGEDKKNMKKLHLEGNRGYAHGFASPNAPSLGGSRRREDDEYHVPDPAPSTWYIRADGKIIKDKMGTPFQYRDKEAARKAAMTMMAKPFNAGKKFVLTTQPEDNAPVAEDRTETKNEKGEVTGWRDESDWRKISKDKNGRGKVTNLSDKARRETEKLTKKQGVAEGSGFDQEAGIGIDGKSFKFKIRDLVALADNYPVTKIDPQQFSKQIAGRDEDSTQSMARAEKADLQYPIIVVKRQNGQLWIADGTHRAHKAIMHKLPSINAKIIPIKDMAPFDVDQGVAEGLPQTLRKVVPGYAKREIDKKMDAEKFGRTDVDRDANYYRYKKIQDKIKEQGVAEGMEGQVVYSGTGDNGGKYEIIQSGPDSFMIHANGKHVDTYQSLQRAMGVLQNEVPGLTKEVDEASLKLNYKRNRFKSLRNMHEEAEELSVGDPVIITGQGIEFEGKTGDIDSFGDMKRFVVVNLYNHGRHSFHSSDVSYNDYADKEDDLDEDLYQYDKEDPYNSEFAPRAGMGRMTLRGWKQQMIRRTAELAQQMSVAGQDIDKAALWDHVYAKLKSMNMDPIAQEIEQAQAELEKIRQRGGVRSRAFNK